MYTPGLFTSILDGCFVLCYSELLDGVTVYDEENRKITESRYAAMKGITLVTFCRILISSPSMCKYSVKLTLA